VNVVEQFEPDPTATESTAVIRNAKVAYIGTLSNQITRTIYFPSGNYLIGEGPNFVDIPGIRLGETWVGINGALGSVLLSEGPYFP
jgi:hypothetical protein